MPDRFADYAISLESPAVTGFAVTPNDGTDLSDVTRAVYVGGSGNVSAVLQSGAEVVFVGLTSGSVLPARLRRIKATGTTATNLVGLA
jgi:hypothetical protein